METRQKFDVVIKVQRTNNSKINSINYKLGNAWNELPFTIKDGTYKTVRTFSKHVKHYYLSKYNIHCELNSCYICNRK